MNRPSGLAALGWIIPLLAAVLLRFGDLEGRPLHNDEAINARKLAQLWEGDGYRYDPHEYHGPTLYYLALPVLRVAAVVQPDQPEIAAFRFTTVLCGLGLVLVVGWIADGLGRTATWLVAAFTAVSPAMVYYSRYFIHEPVLVLATAIFLAALWRFSCVTRSGRLDSRFVWALVAGAGLGLMWATKETFVFAVGAAGAGGLMVLLFGPDVESPAATATATATAVSDRGWAGKVRDRWRQGAAAIGWGPCLVFAGAALVVGALFLSSFGTHPRGVVDSLRTYFVWGQRAGGATPHVQSWSFYLSRLLWFHGRGAPVWTEALILGLGFVGAVAGWLTSRPGGADPRLVRFVTGYTVVLAAGYSAIPYKTPWCLLGFWHGVLVLAGVGAAWLLRALRGSTAGSGEDRQGREWSWMRFCRGVVALVLAAGTAHLAVQAWRGSREYGADFRNPYVYGHTSADLANLLELIRDLSAVHPERSGMTVQVAVPESGYWPLPWYLRRFRAVGWWDKLPPTPFADVVITAVKLGAALDEKTGQAWRPAGMFELRPRYFVEVYVEAGLWKRFLAARAATRPAEP